MWSENFEFQSRAMFTDIKDEKIREDVKQKVLNSLKRCGRLGFALLLMCEDCLNCVEKDIKCVLNLSFYYSSECITLVWCPAVVFEK
jgi:hypothetical protein